MINELTGNTAGITFAKRRNWDTKSRLLASIDKANNLIGYQPNTEFTEGISNTVDWFKQNWDLIDKVAQFGPGASSAVREISN